MRTITVLFVSAALLVGCGGGDSKPKLDENGLNFIAEGLRDDVNVAMQDGKSTLTKKQALEISGIQGIVSTTQLAKEYDANEVSADEKYKKKPIIVNGRVQSINKDFMDKPYLVLSGSNMFQTVQAKFDKANTSELSSMKKGQNVQLVCQVDNYVIGSVMLGDCQNLNSYLVRQKDKIKSLGSDIVLGKQSMGEKNDETIRSLYIIGKNLPLDSPCHADIASKECQSALKNLPEEVKAKVKAEIDAAKPKSTEKPR